jgi:hypothetical protein
MGFVAFGGCDWNAGVPACNAAASAASNFDDPDRASLFVLRTHAGGDACVPVASAMLSNKNQLHSRKH